MIGIILTFIFTLLFLTSCSIGLFAKQLGERSNRIGVPAIMLSLVASIWVLMSVISGGPAHLELPLLFRETPDWFRLCFYVDRLAAVMMVLIAGVSTIIHMYSVNYLQGDQGYARFYALLGFMSLVLLGMVTSGNLFMLFVCWQLVSWLLYLLLSYNCENGQAMKTAFKSFLVLRLGDVAFLCGLLLAYRTYGTLEFPALFERATATAGQSFPVWSGGPEVSIVTVITVLLFIGAMSKSAQLPLHGWLPDTMDAPTPVSALMHAGIVNAGGFLINRLAPLYGLSTVTLHVVFAIGLLTAIIGTGIMLTRTDIKTKLGFSTMGQMGFMIMECGLGAFALAIFHLIAHGIFKATLFLSAGNVIHKVRRDPKSPTQQAPAEPEPFYKVPWITGVLLTLGLPLILLLAAHTIMGAAMYQGTVIFLFFAWVTSSQAIMSLYSLKSIGARQVATIMVLAVGLVMGTYLWCAETFSNFLYPIPGQAERYFHAASFPLGLFDLFTGIVVLLFLAGWFVIYPNSKGQQALTKRWHGPLTHLYMLFWNRLYLDRIFAMLGRRIVVAASRLDAALPEWIP